jgi:RNA polymerase sigma-70 factor (ECF subfamily)
LKESLLIKSILDGNAQEYAILINRYKRPIFNLLFRMTGNREDAADLAQETFLKAYNNLEKFKLSESFFPWLYAIALNLARDSWRKQKHATKYAEEVGRLMENSTEENTYAEDRILVSMDAKHLKNCLNQLPHNYREALILRYHEGLPMGDIGKALGVSTSGAKMRISRGLEKLRDLFQSSFSAIKQVSKGKQDN